MAAEFFLFGVCVLLAGVLWFIPIPENLPVKGWHVFSVFIAVITSFIFLLAKPLLKDTREAQAVTRRDLEEIGRWSKGEKIIGVVLPVLPLLWVTKPLHGTHTKLVARIGVSILLITNTEKWQDRVENDKAWETLIWIDGLLTMEKSLREHGFIDWFAQTVGVWFADVSGITVVLVMALIYFYSMYSFSTLSAHIAAKGTVFLAMSLGTGTGDAHGRHIRIFF